MKFKYDHNKLNYERVKRGLRDIFIADGWLWTFVLAVALGLNILREQKTYAPFVKAEKEIIILKKEGCPPITVDRLVQEIKESGIIFPEIVFAQAIEESDHFRSPLCRDANNLFGMGVPGQRMTTMNRVVRGQSGFKTWKHSVRDMALYQATFLWEIKTREEYYDYLARRYAKNPYYVSRIKTLVKQYEKLFL